MLAQIRGFFSALPDALTALLYLVTWIAPLHWGTDVVGNLMLVMLLEFLVVHSGGFIGMKVLDPNASRTSKTVAVIGFGLFYMIFVLAFSLAFKRSWVIGAFAWLLLGKLVTVWFSPLPAARESDRQRELWGLSVLAYIGWVFVTVLLPLPRLGLQPDVVAQLGLPGSGLWVEKPHTVIAFGLLYFATLAWMKWYGAIKADAGGAVGKPTP